MAKATPKLKLTKIEFEGDRPGRAAFRAHSYIASRLGLTFLSNGMGDAGSQSFGIDRCPATTVRR
jgi:hypothetical protein